MSEEDMTEDEAKELLRQFSESKQNAATFFTNVVKAKDTTKVGNLDKDELGTSKLPVRTYKELELFSRDIAGDDTWADYFKQMSEIQSSTSLSKEGFLMKLFVTSKKELADMTPHKKNKGWFKKKDKDDTQ